MEEIANQIFIEQSYPGVVSSVLRLKHGLALIDGPSRPDDRQGWQHKLIHLGGGIGQLMVLLDTHSDRLINLSMFEGPILAQENVSDILRELPVATRLPEKQTESESEPLDGTSTSRFCFPDMTYSQQLSLHWDDQPVVVTHQPGGHPAGSWVSYDAEKVIFIGDSVMVGQPPFLAWCHLDRWLEALTWLSSDFFKHYQIVSSRDGVVNQNSVLRMIEILHAVKDGMNDLRYEENPHDGLASLGASLLSQFTFDQDLKEPYQNRLISGLNKLYARITADGYPGEISAGA